MRMVAAYKVRQHITNTNILKERPKSEIYKNILCSKNWTTSRICPFAISNGDVTKNFLHLSESVSLKFDCHEKSIKQMEYLIIYSIMLNGNVFTNSLIEINQCYTIQIPYKMKVSCILKILYNSKCMSINIFIFLLNCIKWVMLTSKHKSSQYFPMCFSVCILSETGWRPREKRQVIWNGDWLQTAFPFTTIHLNKGLNFHPHTFQVLTLKSIVHYFIEF